MRCKIRVPHEYDTRSAMEGCDIFYEIFCIALESLV